MKRTARLAVVVAGMALAASTVARPALAAPPVVLDEAALAAGLLAPATMPEPGWVAADPGVVESRPVVQANDIEGGWCGGATDSYAAGELQVAATAASTLAKAAAPGEPTWFLWTKAFSFPDAARAKSFLANVGTAAASCDGWVLDGEPVNGVTAATIALPKIANETLALRATTSGDGVSETRDYVYVRVRNNVVVTHTRILPPDDVLVRKIAKRSGKLLKQAVNTAA